jgi:hypothetical protein
MFDGKLRFNINAINRSRKGLSGPNSGPNYNYIYRQALIRNPTEPIYTDQGEWFERSVYFYDNPLRAIEEVEAENKNMELRLSGSVIFSPIKDLNLKLLVAGNKFNSLAGHYETWNNRASVDNNRTGYASRNTGFSRNDLLEFTGDYNKSVGDHTFTVLGGYSYQYEMDESFSAFNSNFPSDLYSYNRIESGDALTMQNAPVGMNSGKEDWKLIGFFGRINYSWKNKYMLMASLRHEGSTKFGENYKWGNFPAISLGWRINNESFMDGLDIFNELKLRAGYGITGTLPNDNYPESGIKHRG